MGMDGDVSVHMTNTSRPHLMKTKRPKCCVLQVNFCLYYIMPVLVYSKLILWSCNLNHPMSFIPQRRSHQISLIIIHCHMIIITIIMMAYINSYSAPITYTGMVYCGLTEVNSVLIAYKNPTPIVCPSSITLSATSPCRILVSLNSILHVISSFKTALQK